jgi:predicted mannosyl-3-phosphoglycerate phosphatase (HAD superfamily)
MSTSTQPTNGLTINLSQFPEFQTVLNRLDQQDKEIRALKARQLKWVTDEQAQQITGLSRDTLRRARRAADSVIIWKEDHGLRYDYDSLLAHNARRSLGRGRLAQLLAS